jgi:hypothetical protein
MALNRAHLRRDVRRLHRRGQDQLPVPRQPKPDRLTDGATATSENFNRLATGRGRRSPAGDNINRVCHP